LQLLLLLLLLRLGGLEQCFEVMLIHAATVTAPIMGSKATFCPSSAASHRTRQSSYAWVVSVWDEIALIFFEFLSKTFYL
jgi:hypothetical protein